MSLKTIKFRRDTAANWTSTNPTLASGEPGFETDTFKHKIGNGATAYNDLPYVVGGSADVHAGTVTLASGAATVAADWITTDSVIVALPQAAPSTAGAVIYADPADIVDATSFMVKSDDATDSRAVYWMTSPQDALPGLGLPDTFYVTFRARFNTAEASGGGPPFAFNVDLLNEGFAAARALDFQIWQSGVPFYDTLAVAFWGADFSNGYAEYDSLTIDADTYYVFDLKFVLSPDHKTQTVTVRLDGVVLGTNVSTSTLEWMPTNFVTGGVSGGGTLSGGGVTINRDFDYFYIGSTTYGTSDIFSADFTSTIVPPYDSIVGTTPPSIVSGAMHVEDASDSVYALRGS